MTHIERHEQRKSICAALRAGQEITDVAAQFGLNARYVRQIGLFADVIQPNQPKTRGTQGPGKPYGQAVAILAALLNTSDSHSAIARKLNMTRQRVSQVMQEATTAGIVIPGRNECQP